VSATEEKAVALAPERILHLLSNGEIEVEGLIPWSSNATLLVTVRDQEAATLAIYKPQGGERPLWDFPYGSLGAREVAAYLVCEALDWGFIPPTVWRRGPHGFGSVQLFIDAREDAHFFTIQDDPVYHDVLQRLAAFDVIVNNADRKSGHCLLDREGRLWAIDNALTFHEEPKLRTVIWDFAGQTLPANVLAALEALRAIVVKDSPLSQALGQLLSGREVAAFRRRLRRLIDAVRFPEPGPGRAVPWPLV
jgi:uncharacterized repeat protein (TIGR03843 family)